MIWHLLFVMISVLLLTPLTSLLLSAGLAGQTDRVVANTDLLAFVLSPAGVAWTLLAASIVAALAAVRFAGVAFIITDRANGHRSSLFRTGVRVLSRAPVIARLSALLVGIWLLVTAVLLGGLALIYQLLLGEFDINYYLSIRPAEVYYALVTAAAWVFLWLAMVAGPAGRSLLAFPAVLLDRQNAVQALRGSWNRQSGPSRRTVLRIAITLVVFTIVRIVGDAAAALVGRHFILTTMRLSPWMQPVVVAIGVTAIILFLLDTLLSLAGHACTSAVITRAWLQTHPAAEAVSLPIPIPQRRRLYRWLTPRRLLPLILVLSLVGLSAGTIVLRSLPEPHHTIIYAHRTGPPPAPENTLSALEAAIAAGAEYTEIDVQQTADGSLVIVHDADLMRVARDPRRVRDLRSEDLHDIIQLPDDGSPPAERRIATLEEFLDRGAGRIRFMIELKYYGFDPALAEAVVSTVRDRDMEDQVVLMSLSQRAVTQLGQLAPDMPTGFVSSVAAGNLQRLPVDFLAVHQQAVTPTLLRRARQRGMAIHAWTVNDPAAMASLMVLGVDGLITDDPARAAAIRTAIEAFGPVERFLVRFGIGTEYHLGVN